MGINVGGGGKGGVTQPVLNLLHGDALTEQEAGTGMPQIMKANVSQSVLLQKQLEVVGNIVGAKEFAHLVQCHTAAASAPGRMAPAVR